MRVRSLYIVFVLLLVTSLITGCAIKIPETRKGGQGYVSALGEQTLDIPGTKRKSFTVSRSKYKKALDIGGAKNKARLVEIYRRTPSSMKGSEYRLLDVGPNSVYKILGLQSRDVVVAANNFPIPSQAGFWHYINMIPSLKEATINIRREGVPYLISYRLVD